MSARQPPVDWCRDLPPPPLPPAGRLNRTASHGTLGESCQTVSVIRERAAVQSGDASPKSLGVLAPRRLGELAPRLAQSEPQGAQWSSITDVVKIMSPGVARLGCVGYFPENAASSARSRRVLRLDERLLTSCWYRGSTEPVAGASQKWLAGGTGIFMCKLQTANR